VKKLEFIIGIDEVGRGPIAGPVAVGAFVFLKPEARKFFKGVRESKQLTEQKRKEWFERILLAQKFEHIDFAVSFQSEEVIDEKGISFAIKKCIEMSLKKLIIFIDLANTLILLDGGLKASPEYKNQKTIIKGDEKEMIIALASICAKVLRDRKMKILAKTYTGYGFELHKGYGTKKHYEAINKYGLCPIHRRSFITNYS